MLGSMCPLPAKYLLSGPTVSDGTLQRSVSRSRCSERRNLIIPLSNLDDRIAVLFYPDGKQNRTAADGAVFGETLTRAGSWIDANVVLLSAIWAHVGSIVFKRHCAPYVREMRVHDGSTLPGCRSATRTLLEVLCEPGIEIARLGFADLMCYRVRVRFQLGTATLTQILRTARYEIGRNDAIERSVTVKYANAGKTVLCNRQVRLERDSTAQKNGARVTCRLVQEQRACHGHARAKAQ